MAAIVVGTVVAIMRVSPSPVLRAFASAYVWFFRGVPALIQLIFWFNLSLLVREFSLALPFTGTIFSVRTNDFMTPFFSAVVALSLCEAGYMAEIIRAGIKSVPSGQAEAASALGMRYRLILKRIILPQAMRFVVPPTGNEAINLLKMTSLVTFIAVDDLFYSAQSIYARTFETIPLLIVVAFWYLAVVSIMSIGQHFLERHFGRSDKRHRSGDQECGPPGLRMASLRSRPMSVAKAENRTRFGVPADSMVFARGVRKSYGQLAAGADADRTYPMQFRNAQITRGGAWPWGDTRGLRTGDLVRALGQ